MKKRVSCKKGGSLCCSSIPGEGSKRRSRPNSLTLLSKCSKGELRTQLEIEKTRSELQTEIERVRAELKTDIEKLRTELKTDIEKLRAELKTDIEKVRGEVERVKYDLLKWQIAGWLALVAVMAKGFNWLGF